MHLPWPFIIFWWFHQQVLVTILLASCGYEVCFTDIRISSNNAALQYTVGSLLGNASVVILVDPGQRYWVAVEMRCASLTTSKKFSIQLFSRGVMRSAVSSCMQQCIWPLVRALARHCVRLTYIIGLVLLCSCSGALEYPTKISIVKPTLLYFTFTWKLLKYSWKTSKPVETWVENSVLQIRSNSCPFQSGLLWYFLYACRLCYVLSVLIVLFLPVLQMAQILGTWVTGTTCWFYWAGLEITCIWKRNFVVSGNCPRWKAWVRSVAGVYMC